jgi:hypothetical protein
MEINIGRKISNEKKFGKTPLMCGLASITTLACQAAIKESMPQWGRGFYPSPG